MAARQAQEPDDFAAEPRSLDLLDYWSIVRRRWRLVVVVAVFGALAGAGYAVAKGPSYTATAQVVVQPVTQGPLNQATQASGQVNMSTEQAIAQSAAVISTAANSLGLPATTLQRAAAARLSVTVPASTLTTSNVLEINWEADSPGLAQSGADAFANAYLAYRHRELAGQILLLENTLKGQTASLRTQITSLSTQLSGTSGTSTRRILTIRLDELSSQEGTAEAQLAALPTYNSTGGIVIKADLPGKPSSFGKSVIIPLGLVLGFLFGLVAAFGRDLADDRLRDAGQFEQRLGAITLAELPSAEALGGTAHGRSAPVPAGPPIAIAASPDSRGADAARALRATVVAVATRQDFRALLVVAADSSMSSGRVVAELGVALAESGRRVLLLSSDLRNSIMPQIFDIPNNIGLSELLIKGGDPEVLTRRPRQASGATLPASVAERLSVLPSGQRTMLALSILDSSKMLDILRGQREAHDFVLLDSPPATESDVLSLATHVDGVIVLGREGHTKGRTVEALRHRLGQLGVPIVGGVFVVGGRQGRWKDKSPGQGRQTNPAERSGAAGAARSLQPVPASETRPLPAVPADRARSSAAGGSLKQPR